MHNTETLIPIAGDPLIPPETLVFFESKGHALALAAERMQSVQRQGDKYLVTFVSGAVHESDTEPKYRARTPNDTACEVVLLGAFQSQADGSKRDGSVRVHADGSDYDLMARHVPVQAWTLDRGVFGEDAPFRRWDPVVGRDRALLDQYPRLIHDPATGECWAESRGAEYWLSKNAPSLNAPSLLEFPGLEVAMQEMQGILIEMLRQDLDAFRYFWDDVTAPYVPVVHNAVELYRCLEELERLWSVQPVLVQAQTQALHALANATLLYFSIIPTDLGFADKETDADFIQLEQGVADLFLRHSSAIEMMVDRVPGEFHACLPLLENAISELDGGEARLRLLRETDEFLGGVCFEYQLAPSETPSAEWPPVGAVLPS